MKFSTTAFATAIALIAGAAFAETEATDPTVIARQDLMKSFGGAAKTLGEMAGGKVAFDAAAAEKAKAALVKGSAEIAATFEKTSTDPGSKSSPDIWKNWDDFLVKAKGLTDAATALDVASAESIGAGMGPIGGACKACHTSYRLK
jgi:cytochrome c556